MSDVSSAYVAYLTAQQRTAAFAHEARPDAPTHPALVAAHHGIRQVLVRHQVSLALHHLADRIEPTPTGGNPAMADR